MDRKQFLKKLGLGALAVTVAPKVIGDVKEAPLKVEEPIKEEADTYHEATTLEPNYDVIMSDGFIEAERHWHDEVLRKLFLKDYNG